MLKFEGFTKPFDCDQAKVRLLAGGSDGEQLAEVLLDREEELRTKEYELAILTRQVHAASEELTSFESDRSEYTVTRNALSKDRVSNSYCVLISSRL
jgi:hypothetical protein